MRLQSNVRVVLSILALSLAVATAYAAEGESAEDLIARAMSAAPMMVSGEATIVDDEGNVLREGSNGWVCAPNVFPNDGYPMCVDEVWQGWVEAFKAGEDFSTDRIGISYMLKGDGGTSNSDPMHPNPQEAEDFIQEGPHLMIVVPREMLEGITDDPYSGDPYVMWKDTPYAHIMVPVGDRE